MIIADYMGKRQGHGCSTFPRWKQESRLYVGLDCSLQTRAIGCVRQVLDGEGLRTTLSYISGALPRGDMSDAVGGGDVNVGNQEKSEGAQEEAGNAVEKEGREGEPIVETDNGETSRENITRVGRTCQAWLCFSLTMLRGWYHIRCHTRSAVVPRRLTFEM